MTLSIRRKLIIIPLLLYWPTIFVLTHMRIPALVRKAGVFDKYLHFMAYLILVYLLWLAAGAGRKIQWLRVSVWLVLFTAVVYSALDEWLQTYVVGRSGNVTDFISNLTGCAAGLILLTFFSAWPALLIVTGIVIFLLSNLSQFDLSKLLPVTTSLFYFFAYMFFSLVWIRNVQFFLPLSRLRFGKLKWLAISLVLPIALLFFVRLFSVIFGNKFAMLDVVISAVAIVVVVGVFFLVGLFAHRATEELSGCGA